jgi:hypothetical protein
MPTSEPKLFDCKIRVTEPQSGEQKLFQNKLHIAFPESKDVQLL